MSNPMPVNDYDFYDEIYKLNEPLMQKSNRIATVSLVCMALAGIFLVSGIIAGALAFAFVTATLFTLMWIFLTNIIKRYDNQCKKNHDDIVKKRMADLDIIRKSAASIIDEAHEFFRKCWNMPNDTESVKLLSYNTADDLRYAQQKIEFWNFSTEIYHIWVDNSMLYLLRNVEGIKESSHIAPERFSNLESAKQNISRIAIPLEDIHYFSASGEVYNTHHVSGGEFKQYIGASVGGIGFGEIQMNPISVESKTHDNRFVTLYYKKSDMSTLQTLYFTIESLDSFVKTIPQFER